MNQNNAARFSSINCHEAATKLAESVRLLYLRKLIPCYDDRHLTNVLIAVVRSVYRNLLCSIVVSYPGYGVYTIYGIIISLVSWMHAYALLCTGERI